MKRRRHGVFARGQPIETAAPYLTNHPTGYTDQMIFASGGNPYGTSAYDTLEGEDLEAVLNTAAYQGKRLAKFAGGLAGARQVSK